MSKVSVIIPAYNCAPYITEAIESVIKQTYKDIEIIIVDGSTDNTKEILKGYIEQGIVKYIYQKPQGVAAARNAGIISAKGDYIAFLDADDLWDPDKTGQQMHVFKQYPGAGLVFTDYQKVDESRSIKQKAFFERLEVWFERHRSAIKDVAYGWLYRELLIGNCIHTSSVIMKRDILEKVGLFDETFKVSEDYDLWLRIAQKYPTLYVNRVLCTYRWHPDGLSGPSDVRGLRWNHAHIMVLEKHLANNWIPLEFKGLVKEVLGQRCWDMGWYYFGENLFKESRPLFSRCMRCLPFDWKNWLYWIASFLPLPIIEAIRRMKRIALWQKYAQHVGK